jgi:hypothetical protein
MINCTRIGISRKCPFQAPVDLGMSELPKKYYAASATTATPQVGAVGAF